MSCENHIGPVATQDEQCIRALLSRMFKAWENGDGEAYARCFTGDCDYITYNGIHLKGRSENASLHGTLFRTVLRGTKLCGDIECIEFLAPGVALMRTAAHERKKSYQTYVLTKVGNEWLVRSFQNTKVRALSVWMTRLMQFDIRRRA
jgi:uncharacterized protein (TIGR02246 family)